MNKCKKHPTYKVIRKPTADCEPCRKLWAEKLKERKEWNIKS